MKHDYCKQKHYQFPVQFKVSVRIPKEEKLPHTGKIFWEMNFTAEMDSVQTKERLVRTLEFDVKLLAAEINEQAY